MGGHATLERGNVHLPLVHLDELCCEVLEGHGRGVGVLQLSQLTRRAGSVVAFGAWEGRPFHSMLRPG